MNGREVFKFATRVMVSFGREAARRVRPDGRRHRPLRPAPGERAHHRSRVKKLGIPEEKVVVNVDRYGNTSSGSIPLALARGGREAGLVPGELRTDDRYGRRTHLGVGVDRMD